MLISFEGGEGAGKSTQAALLVQHLAEDGHHPVLIHEPGTTPLGWYLREWLKSRRPLSPWAELYLFAAARAELVSREILPALRRGAIVVADRYADSTVAYQGHGRRLDLEHIRSLNQFATQNTMPDLTILLDLPPEEALRRVGPVQLPLLSEETESLDIRWDLEGRRFEDERLQFHHRVRAGYSQIAREQPGRWIVLDGTIPSLNLAEQIWAEVAPRLQGHARSPAPLPQHPLIPMTEEQQPEP